MRHWSRTVCLLPMLWALLWPISWAIASITPRALVAQQTPPQKYRFVLVLRDARTGEPVEGAEMRLQHDGRNGASTRAASRDVHRSDSAGMLTGPSALPRLTVSVRRLGYAEWRGDVRADGRSQHLDLTPVAATLDAVAVRARALGDGGVLQASTVISSQQLAERMAPSVAATIASEPGVSARSNGPMATQPVIRGLGGDRVLVLEDGLRTGDIASTAPDHAVTVEPMTARRIEVIRGPAGLLYGSNTLGGVVNVIRDDVPRARPQGMPWQLSTYAESVNSGVGGAARIGGAAGALVWQLDGSSRTAGDTRTPRGAMLPFTDLDGFDAGAGLSLVSTRGHAGVAVRDYRTFYGVPSSFGGVTLPGAHDGGVYIDVRRSVARMDAEWRPRAGVLEAVTMSGSGVRFEQSEFERGGFVGTRFGQLSASGEVVARIVRGRHRAAFGSAAQWRDLRAAGSFTGTRPAVQRNVSLFAVNETRVGGATLIAGVRVDDNLTRPLDSTETLLLRDVRTRAFRAVTGAVGARVPIGGGWSGTVQWARAFRPPSIEELFSAGPHLASYAYEVGVPSLAAERGSGLDGMLRWQGRRGRAEFAAYRMRIADFITFAPQIDSATGLPLRDPRLRRYTVYRPGQQHAILTGLESRIVLAPTHAWTIDIAGALPRGSAASGVALPAMPAPTLRADMRRTFGGWSAGVILDGRFAQSRVPRPPSTSGAQCDVRSLEGEASALPAEFCPTPGVLLVGAVLSIPVPRAWRSGWRTALTISADNLFDSTWRDPLWRAKQVAPQPGRNVRVALQVTP